MKDDFISMPKALTAENGAKCLFSGEFKETSEHECEECVHEEYPEEL